MLDKEIFKKQDTLNEYAIFLEPEDDIALNFRELIEYFSSQCNTPIFKPHVTLIGGLSDSPEILMEKMKVLASKYKSPIVKFLSVETTPKYYQAIILKCEKTDSLMKLNLEAQKLFCRNYEYEPHLSLMYGNTKDFEKKSLLKKSPSISLTPLSFIVAKMSLWHAKGGVKDWVMIGQERCKKG